MAPSIDAIPLPDGEPGRLFAAGIAAVGPDPDGALDEVGAHTLVCLVGDDEIELLFPDLGVWLAATDRAVRLPIPDYGTPEEDDMVGLVDELVRRLGSGEGLVVHCRGGIGRTSLVCASLLMRLGYDHDQALAHVGAHREGAGPETSEQMAFLKSMAARSFEIDR